MQDMLLVQQMRDEGQSVMAIAEHFGVSRMTLQRRLRPYLATRENKQQVNARAADPARRRQHNERTTQWRRGEAGQASVRAYLGRTVDRRMAAQRRLRKGREQELAKYQREYKNKNRDILRKKATEYARKRRSSDPQYRLLSQLRCRENQALRRARKAGSTPHLFGCNVETWLSKQPEDLVRGWLDADASVHVDEIRPCSSFDLTDPAQQVVAFNWRNRQLLKAQDNVSKGTDWDRQAWEQMMVEKGWTGELF